MRYHFYDSVLLDMFYYRYPRDRFCDFSKEKVFGKEYHGIARSYFRYRRLSIGSRIIGYLYLLDDCQRNQQLQLLLLLINKK